jgi:outer membrane protein OmpA-like peptidoglycan-associated protein
MFPEGGHMKSLIFIEAAVLLSIANGSSASKERTAKKPASTAINVTGTWNANFSGGMDLLLHQEGSLVWGKDNGGSLIRGDWSDGRLVLFYRLDFKGAESSSCSAPVIAVLTSKGTATRMDGVEFLAGGDTQKKTLNRASPNAGADFTYPYGAELKGCGSLPAHDLVFETSSDKLKGTDWPMLAAVSTLLKQETGLKIEVAGHTDSTGDAEKNRDLSQRRAKSVKKVLVERYGAGEAQISTKGWGAEQPLATNDTDDGRAVNRRVEILVVR